MGWYLLRCGKDGPSDQDVDGPALFGPLKIEAQDISKDVLWEETSEKRIIMYFTSDNKHITG